MHSRSAKRFAASVRTERASGVLSTVFGVAIMLGLLAVTVHVAVGLWARTSTESIAYDAAREVATAPQDTATVRAEALQRARTRLGSSAGTVQMGFVHGASPEVVALHVTSEPVSLMPAMVGGVAIVDGLDKTITIRREQGPTP